MDALPGTGLSNAQAPQPLVLSSGVSSGSASNSPATSAAKANSEGVTFDVLKLGPQDAPAMVTVSLPKSASTVGSGFSFDLPESVRSMAGADAGIQITQADGSPPPDWLKFDLAAMRFEALGVPDGAFPMQLVLVIEGQRVTVVISERT